MCVSHQKHHHFISAPTYYYTHEPTRRQKQLSRRHNIGRPLTVSLYAKTLQKSVVTYSRFRHFLHPPERNIGRDLGLNCFKYEAETGVVPTIYKFVLASYRVTP